jgi:hypothetical protein
VRRRVNHAASERPGRTGDRFRRHGKKREGEDCDDGVSHKEERR